MDYRKIAKIFRKAQVFIIWRKEEDVYWITDTYLLIRLDRKTFCKFKAKYSSYVKSPYIEDLEVGEKVKLDFYGEGLIKADTDIESVMDDSKAKEAKLTRLNLDSLDEGFLSVIAGDDYWTCINKKYADLFGHSKKYKCEGKNKIIFVYENNELTGMIMPIRYETVRNSFRDLEGVI